MTTIDPQSVASQLARADRLREQELIETLVSVARAADAPASTPATAFLQRAAMTSRIAAAWLPHLGTYEGVSRARIDFSGLPARSRVLLSWHDIHLHSIALGDDAGWQRWVALGRPRLFALVEPNARLSSPLVVVALRTALDLASAAGDWATYETLLAEAREVAPDGTRRLLVELADARTMVRRDCRREALLRCRQHRETASARGLLDVALAFEALGLDSLVALGPIAEISSGAQHLRERDEEICMRWSSAKLLYAACTEAGDRSALSTTEREQWWQVAMAAAHRAGLIDALNELGPLDRLLAREERWRRSHDRRPAEAEEIIAALEDHLDVDAQGSYERMLHASLARCRLRLDVYGRRTEAELRALPAEERARIVEGADHEMRRISEELVDCANGAARRGLPELEIQAHDLRAIVLDRLGDDATHAVQAAATRTLELLGKNAAHGDECADVERGMLERFWPVLDRGIDLRVAHALDHPDEWAVIGTEVYAQVEQCAVLVLDEVRRVHRGELAETRPRELAWAPPPSGSEARHERLQRGLGTRDLVLQYFVGARYVIVFAIDRHTLAWDLLAPDANDRRTPWSTRDLRIALDAAAQGDWARSALAIPDAVARWISGRRYDNLFIVPHAELWDVPFASLSIDGLPLGACCAISMHACATSLLRALEPLPPDPTRREAGMLAIGPRVLDAVIGALRCASDRLGWKRSEATESSAPSLPSARHTAVVCHGAPPRDGTDLGTLALGDGTVSVVDVRQMDLKRTRLLLLLACWAGQPGRTRRSDPILSFPHAMLDAGASTVVAPRFPLPQALAPYLVEDLGLLARFLPVAEAMRRCLTELHRCWPALTASDTGLRETLAPRSPFEFELRLHGAVGRHATARWPRRVAARLEWWWRVLLRRRLSQRSLRS